MAIFKKRKGQWARMQANQNRKTGRRNRVLFTSYLMEKGYDDTQWLASFWDMSSSTVRDYKKEAQYKNLADQDRERIKEIMDEEDCDLPTAVMKHYNQLMSSNSACFIASAAYGTPIHSDIDLLRDFRDDVLKESFLGRKFVDFYYLVSPPIARQVDKRPRVAGLVRSGLKPIISVVEILQNE